MSERVIVCVDFASPHAWLAMAPTRALEQKLDTAFDWRPRNLPPIPRAKPLTPDATRGERHRSVRAAYVERDLIRYAESQGLELRDPYRRPETLRAALGLLYLRKRAPERSGEFAARMFGVLWQDDPDTVSTGLGTEFEAYTTREGPAELAANDAELERLGAWNVPAYLVHGELFLGRQHLPMVEWLVRGRSGPPPI